MSALGGSRGATRPPACSLGRVAIDHADDRARLAVMIAPIGVEHGCSWATSTTIAQRAARALAWLNCMGWRALACAIMPVFCMGPEPETQDLRGFHRP